MNMQNAKNKDKVTCCGKELDLGMVQPVRVRVDHEQQDATDKDRVKTTERLVYACPTCKTVLRRIIVRRKQ